MMPTPTPQPFELGPVGSDGTSLRLDKDPFTGLDLPAPAPPPMPVPIVGATPAAIPADVMLLGPDPEPPVADWTVDAAVSTPMPSMPTPTLPSIPTPTPTPMTTPTLAPMPPMPPPPRFEKPEVPPASYMPAPRKRGLPKTVLYGIGAVALVAAAVPSVAYFRGQRRPQTQPVAATAAPAAVATGSAQIMSRPDGAEVLVDGVAKGVTPLKLTMPVGTYTMELHNGAATRTLPLAIEAGTSVRQYVDLAPADAGVGRLEVTSDPAGVQVIVDGAARGVTPLVISSIEPGQHRVSVASNDGTVSRTVSVAAGSTASVVLSIAPTGAAGGWVALKAPFELTVLEGGKVIGTTGTDSLMLPAGNHELEVVSTPYSFNTTMMVKVPAGKTVTVPVALPKGTLSINALPWAEITLDGQPMGQTPLGNLSVTIGNHDVVWRHPQLGERRQTVKVTAGAPVRAGMDLSK